MAEQSRTVGRYALRAQLGVGGFATVYRAHDPSLDREVALKILHPYYAYDPSIRERFVREGRALARVRHPHIVHVYEAGEAEDTAYLAMELIEGAGLDDLLALHGTLSLAQVVTIAEQIGGALAAIHQRRIIHRDIKPANVLIEHESERAVLLDLGVARDLANATLNSGLLLGTPAFMAPEQADWDGQVTTQSDVYQLAATLYTLLAGRPPFEGPAVRVLDAIKSKPPPNLAPLRPDLPPAVTAFLMTALAKNPDERPNGPLGLARGLREAATPVQPVPVASQPAAPAALVATAVPLDATTVIERPPATAEPTARRRRAGWWRRAAGAAAGLVLLAAIAAVIRSAAGDAPSSGAAPIPTPAQNAAVPSPSPTAAPLAPLPATMVSSVKIYRSGADFLTGGEATAELSSEAAAVVCYAYEQATGGITSVMVATINLDSPGTTAIEGAPWVADRAEGVRCEPVPGIAGLSAGSTTGLSGGGVVGMSTSRYAVVVRTQGQELARGAFVLRAPFAPAESASPPTPTPSPTPEPTPPPTVAPTPLPTIPLPTQPPVAATIRPATATPLPTVVRPAPTVPPVIVPATPTPAPATPAPTATPRPTVPVRTAVPGG